MYSLSVQSRSGPVIPTILKYSTEAGSKTSEVTLLLGGFSWSCVSSNPVN